MWRGSALAVAAAALLVVAGCGSKEVDTGEAESEIEKGLKRQLPRLGQVEVICPEDVEAKEGDTFRCRARSGRESAPITVTQVDDDGNIRWRLNRPG